MRPRRQWAGPGPWSDAVRGDRKDRLRPTRPSPGGSGRPQGWRACASASPPFPGLVSSGAWAPLAVSPGDRLPQPAIRARPPADGPWSRPHAPRRPRDLGLRSRCAGAGVTPSLGPPGPGHRAAETRRQSLRSRRLGSLPEEAEAPRGHACRPQHHAHGRLRHGSATRLRRLPAGAGTARGPLRQA